MSNNFRLFLKYLKNVKRSFTGFSSPSQLILYVTSKCNAKCAHCFYWEKLNLKNDDMSIDEIEKVFIGIPETISYLHLTGGEPFLRNDLAEICLMAEKYTGTKAIQIPTNGILSDKIIEFVETVFETYKGNITIPISVDNYGNSHDEIRGVPGAFDLAVKTIKKLKIIQDRYQNLSLFINTTVSNKNFKDISKLEHFVEKELGLPHNFEIIRGSSFSTNLVEVNNFNPKDSECGLPKKDDLNLIYRKLLQQRKTSRPKNFIGKIGKEFTLIALRNVYNPLILKKSNVRCLAGELIGVIYSNGDLALCEFTKPVGNLTKSNYNFLDSWRSESADSMRKKLKGCYCTHACFVIPSTMYSHKNILKALMAVFFKIRIGYGKDIKTNYESTAK